METQVFQISWHGLDAWGLASTDLSVLMVPALGAKIVSLVERSSGTEWLIGPGPRPVRPVAYGAAFTEQDMAGWDEMFPTIVACLYPGPGMHQGANLPDHGEAWALPWQVMQAGEGSLSLSMQGRALPYRLVRTADCPEPATLRLRYTLHNLGPDPMPYLWAAHPQFTCGPDSQLIFPPEVREVINTLPESWGWGPPETPFGWPAALAPDGTLMHIDEVGPPSLKRGRKFFVLPQVRPSWAAVLRRGSGQWARFEWDPEEIPYLGLWVDEGAFNYDSVAAPQPTTAWYDDLALAYRNGRAAVLPAGETRTWALVVRLGRDGQPRP